MNVLKLLFNPIFLLAVGLHAGLLLIPIAGGSSDEIVPAPDPEGESITVTRIPPQTTQSARPIGGQPAASRPAADVVTAVRQPATATQTSTTNQQGQQHRTQNSQDSGDRTANGSSNNRRQANSNNRSNRRDNRDSNNEIAVLPADDNSNSRGNSPTNTQTEQTPSTLVALKDGAQSQEVPQPLQNFLVRLRHSILRTTDPEVEEAKQTWLATLSEQPDIQISDPQDLDKAVEISYPLIADHNGTRRFLSCLTPTPAKGLVGIVINPDGEIATAPAILRSSGYEFINDIALERVKDYQNFPDSDTQKLYTINIEVDYDKDACINLSDLKQ